MNNKDIKALIVDDEADIGELLDFFLSPHMSCKIVQNPQDALDQLEDHDFDIVISDFKMNTVDGFDILKKAHQSKSNCAKVLMTGAFLRPDELKDACSFDVLLVEKPFSDPDLLISSILDVVNHPPVNTL